MRKKRILHYVNKIFEQQMALTKCSSKEEVQEVQSKIILLVKQSMAEDINAFCEIDDLLQEKLKLANIKIL